MSVLRKTPDENGDYPVIYEGKQVGVVRRPDLFEEFEDKKELTGEKFINKRKNDGDCLAVSGGFLQACGSAREAVLLLVSRARNGD